jgi:hypothetical protein
MKRIKDIPRNKRCGTFATGELLGYFLESTSPVDHGLQAVKMNFSFMCLKPGSDAIECKVRKDLPHEFSREEMAGWTTYLKMKQACNRQEGYI